MVKQILKLTWIYVCLMILIKLSAKEQLKKRSKMEGRSFRSKKRNKKRPKLRVIEGGKSSSQKVGKYNHKDGY